MLESVVFAHQDESLWPFGDAQGLKKRFDDLFASTKYAKALDALRKLRVEKTAAFKLGKAKAERLKEIAKSAARERAAASAAESRLAELARMTAATQRALERNHERLRAARESVSELYRAEAAAKAAQEEAARAAGDAEAKKAALRSRYDLDVNAVDVAGARRGAREADEAAADAHRAAAAAQREAATARQRAAAQREQLAADERRLATLDAQAGAARRAAAARDEAARGAEAELAKAAASLLRALQTQQQTQQQQTPMQTPLQTPLSSADNPLVAVLASLPAESVAALTRPLRPPLPQAPAQRRSPTPGAMTAEDSSSSSASATSFIIPEADIERLLAALRSRADACALAVKAARDSAAAADAAAAAEADAAAAALAAAREGSKSKRDVASSADSRALELRERAARLVTGASAAAIKAMEGHVSSFEASVESAERALRGSSAAAEAEDAARRGKEASERAAELRAERSRATKNADRAARARLLEAAAGEAVERLFAALHSRAARARLALLFGGGGGGEGGGPSSISASDFSSWPPPGKMRPPADAAVARARAAEEAATKVARSAAEEAASKRAHLSAARAAAASTSAGAAAELQQLAKELSRARAALGPDLCRVVGLEGAAVDVLREAADAAAEVTGVPSGGNGGGFGGGGPTNPSALPSLATQSPASLLPLQPATLPDVATMLDQALRLLDEQATNAAKLAVFATQSRAVADFARESGSCRTCGQDLAPEAREELVQTQERSCHSAEVGRWWWCCIGALLCSLSRLFLGAVKEVEQKTHFFSILLQKPLFIQQFDTNKQDKKAGFDTACVRLKCGTEHLRTAVLLRDRCEVATGGGAGSSTSAAAAAAAAEEAAAGSQRELEGATARRAALEEAAHEGAWKIDGAAEEWLAAKFAAEADGVGAGRGNIAGGESAAAFSIDAYAEGELLPVSFFLGARNFDDFCAALEEKEKQERRAAALTQLGHHGTQQQQQQGTLRRLQDVEADLDVAERERDAAADAARAASRALEQLRADLAQAQADLARARDALAQKRAQANERVALEKAAEDAEAQAADLRTEAAAAAPAEQSAERALASAAAQRERVRSASRSAEEGAAALASSARALCDSVALLAKAASDAGVAAISATAAPAAGAGAPPTNPERDRVVAALVSGREALSKAEYDARAAEARSAAVEKATTTREIKKRELEDVLAAKEAEARAAGAQRAAERAERAAADLAGPDRGESLTRAVRDAEDLIRRSQSSIDVGRGAQQAAEKQKADAEEAIRAAGEVWRDPEADYRAASAEASALSMAAADVERYHRALEKAILRFHAAKMEEINKAIKELWQRTYKGGDIESIALRADAGDGAEVGGSNAGFFDGSSSAASTSSAAAASASAAAAAATGAPIGGKAARSYNYRLVMATGGAELEMRGRCSAGQKVLASIVVRLALAEVLAVSCGILALDEPTTNLDEANAAALADSLHELVRDADDRRTNLQLIVITHDEAFARRLGDYCPFMWRVEKDDRQCSTIRKVAAREGFGNE